MYICVETLGDIRVYGMTKYGVYNMNEVVLKLSILRQLLFMKVVTSRTRPSLGVP